MSSALRVGLISSLLLCSCTSFVDDKVGAGGTGGGGSAAAEGGSGSGKAAAGDAQTYLDGHNAVRASVEEPDGYAGEWRPLPPVGWSEAAATSAQAWADHLASALDCGLEHEQNGHYGENLAAGTNLGAQRAVELWASESESYSYAPRYVFSSDTGHYTQIVWRASTRIGCASAHCSRSVVVVCRYDPPGNFSGGAIY